LVRLVTEGDFCGRKVNMKKLLAKLKRSQDLYRQGPFSLAAVAKPDVALLVFCGASNDVVGSRESAMHVDRGRTVAFMPPCLEQTFKILVFFRVPKHARNLRAKKTADSYNKMLEDPHTCVIGQRPGDVVYATNQVYHAVLLGYKKGYTKDDDKWGIIGGNIVLKAEDHGAALRYVSGSTIGVSKGSRVAWLRVLSAFTHMEGRGWSEENFEEEKQRFL
ncbi:hypothetical protein PHYSODRAFT_419811, partial [Phytophthora sojae]